MLSVGSREDLRLRSDLIRINLALPLKKHLLPGQPRTLLQDQLEGRDVVIDPILVSFCPLGYHVGVDCALLRLQIGSVELVDLRPFVLHYYRLPWLVHSDLNHLEGDQVDCQLAALLEVRQPRDHLAEHELLALAVELPQSSKVFVLHPNGLNAALAE